MKKTYQNPLFDFHLDNVEDCDCFKAGKAITISWYTLSCGYYRIAAGDKFLLNYSDQIVNKQKMDGNIPDKYFFRRLHENYPSYVDYYVARLWEDLIDMLPVIREPLPEKLEIVMNNPEKWYNKAKVWFDNQPDEEEDKYWDIYYESVNWLSRRKLDNGYLSPSSPIYIYLSKDNMIHIVWDNRDIKIDNITAWSSDNGKFSLPEDSFLQEIELFNHRLLNLMKKRIEVVMSNFSHKTKHPKLEFLIEQHKYYGDYLPNKLKQPTNNENFEKVFEAIEKMDIGYGV